MNEDNGGWQGLLGGLRVPIDPRAIFLGMIVVVLFGGGVFALNEAADRLFDEGNIAFDAGVGGFFASLYDAPFYFQAAAMAWFLVVWSLFGGAVNRIIAVRLAKDDSIQVGEALAYSRRRFLSYFLTPIVLMALVGILLCCNFLAGWVGNWYYVGPILYLILYILVLISSLFIVVLLIGLVFGWNMISSAISTEGCDGIEASISVYNYIFARPWPFIVYALLTVVSTWFVFFAGDFLVNLSYKSTFLQKKVVGYDYHWEKVTDKEVLQRVVVSEVRGGGLLEGLIERDSPVGFLRGSGGRNSELVRTTYFADEKDYEARHKKWQEQVTLWQKAIVAEAKKIKATKENTELAKKYARLGEDKADEKKKIEALMSKLSEEIAEHVKVIQAGPTKEPIEPEKLWAQNWMIWDYIQGTNVRIHRPGVAPTTTEFSYEEIAGKGATMVRLLAMAMLGIYWLLQLVVAGYAVTHILASFTTIYFVMRREVDGTEYEELFEEDEEQFDFSEESAPAAPAPAPAPVPKPAPAPAPAPKAEEKKEEKKADPPAPAKPEAKKEEKKADPPPPPAKPEPKAEEKKEEEKKDDPPAAEAAEAAEPAEAAIAAEPAEAAEAAEPAEAVEEKKDDDKKDDDKK